MQLVDSPCSKAPELLTVNLAITDIGMALSMYPLSIASAFNHAWIGGDSSCLYYGLMGMIFSITSIMTLAVMGMVRYLVSSSRGEPSVIVISGIWLYSCLWAVFPLLGWGSYGPEPFGLACSIDWTGYGESLNHSTFIMALSVLCTFLPCLVILFSYFGIAWKLHRAYQSIQSNDIQYGNVEKKVTLLGPPTWLFSFWSMFHSKEQDHMAPFITLLPCLFAKSSTVYNPFIYFIFQRTFWDKLLCLQRLLPCCSHQANSSVEGRKVEDKMVSSDLIEAPVQSV
ncbi:Opsin-5 G-protein coupled receptor 136 [Larimichthys crocea]|uniref:Opsin-5 G-protein coupled receptor 136 n=1 Tax=Larimichthys crocea TaxID=215358 RepID=A0A6G0HEQ5_LARCR|nr:Opsin-5 G-protein coupled receptor 136 [Larimichthys crocea]